MEFNDKIPIYYQIKQYIYTEIIISHLSPGDKLPAVRQLALDLTVNVNTIQRALSELIDEGVLESKRGKGNFVTEDEAILMKLREKVIETQLQHVYDRLAELQLSPEEMITALQNYIAKRKDDNHD